MTTLLGLALVLLGALCWGGQLLSAIAPRVATRVGLMEREGEVDPVFWADVRAECVWDAMSLWPLPLAGVLLLAGHPFWVFPGLVGGAMFVYFAGRGIAQRRVMVARDIRVGDPAQLRSYFVFLVLWGVAGAAAIGLATVELLGGP